MSSIIELEDNVGLIYAKAAERVLPSTMTLYIPSEKGGGSIEALGSGVLVQYEENYFLITAGHCLKPKFFNTSKSQKISKFIPKK